MKQKILDDLEAMLNRNNPIAQIMDNYRQRVKNQTQNGGKAVDTRMFIVSSDLNTALATNFQANRFTPQAGNGEIAAIFVGPDGMPPSNICVSF